MLESHIMQIHEMILNDYICKFKLKKWPVLFCFVVQVPFTDTATDN